MQQLIHQILDVNTALGSITTTVIGVAVVGIVTWVGKQLAALAHARTYLRGQFSKETVIQVAVVQGFHRDHVDRQATLHELPHGQPVIIGLSPKGPLAVARVDVRPMVRRMQGYAEVPENAGSRPLTVVAGNLGAKSLFNAHHEIHSMSDLNRHGGRVFQLREPYDMRGGEALWLDLEVIASHEWSGYLSINTTSLGGEEFYTRLAVKITPDHNILNQ